MTGMCQDYAVKNPITWINSLSNIEKRVVNFLTVEFNRHGNGIFLVQQELAHSFGCDVISIKRTFAYFSNFGILIKEPVVKDNRYIGIRVTLSNFFSFSRVREALFAFFGIATRTLIKISMLLTENVTMRYKKKTRRENSGSGSARYISSDLCISIARERVVDMKLDESSIRKALAIECALVNKGEVLERIDTAKFMAFSDECLKFASDRMKISTPRKPFGFYVSLCLEWCKDNNVEPQWNIADFVREQNLLDKYRPAVQDSLKQQIANMNQRDARKGRSDQSEKVLTAQERERIKAVNDEKSRITFEQSRARGKYHEYMKQAADQLAGAQPMSPFLADSIAFMKTHLAQHDPQSPEAERIRTCIRELGGTP